MQDPEREHMREMRDLEYEIQAQKRAIQELRAGGHLGRESEEQARAFRLEICPSCTYHQRQACDHSRPSLADCMEHGQRGGRDRREAEALDRAMDAYPDNTEV